MTNQDKLAMLISRRDTLVARPKDNAGVVRKLNRQIRNMQKNM